MGPVEAGPSQPISWTAKAHLTGVFDVGGALPDGRLVVAGSDHVYLLGKDGTAEAIAGGGQGDEAYLTVAAAPAQAVSGASCRFQPGDIFMLRLRGARGIDRIDPAGRVLPFADLTGVDSLNGLAFDTTGRFGHRLLVSGPHGGAMTVLAVDCAGRAELVTDSAPTFEGGLAVAPAGFGAFGGDLIAPDELSGNLLAIRPDGSTEVILRSALPAGGDIGVEGAGFVPAGFLGGGHAYFADRSTPGNPHPGTDTLLSLDSRQLEQAGVREGDLLVATEGGALTIDVRCEARGCAARTDRLAMGPAVAHGEGHLLLVADRPGPAQALPADQQLGEAARTAGVLRIAGLTAGGVALAGLLGLLAWRRRRPG